MKPVCLELQAFGPFVARQRVDFGALGSHGLMLVEGPTGAGKTTLFDAMSYALYGTAPGTRYGVPHELRAHHHAAQSIDTWVSFQFRLGARCYRVERRAERERPKKKGEGVTRQRPQARFYECADDGTETCITQRLEEVGEKVFQLLGFDAKQFHQVLVLPQGQFQEFLLSTSDEKERLLRPLFGDELYRTVTERLMQENRWLANQCEFQERERQSRLRRYGVQSEEELEASLAGLEAACNWMAEEHVRAKNAMGILERDWATAQMREQQFARRDKLAGEQRALLARKDEMQANRARLEVAERVEPLRDLLLRCEEYVRQLETEQKRSSALDVALRDAFVKREAAQLRASEVQANVERVSELQEKRGFVAGLSQMESEIAELHRSIRGLETDKNKWERALQDSEKEMHALGGSLESGTNEKRFIEMFARALKEGEPCVVCGSTVHPAPATNRGAFEAAHDSARHAVERLEATAKEARAQIAKIDVQLEERKAIRDERIKNVHAGTGGVSIRDRLNAMDQEIGALELEVSAARKELEIASQSVARFAVEKEALLARTQEIGRGRDEVEKDLAVRIGERGFGSIEDAQRAALSHEELFKLRTLIHEYSSQCEAVARALQEIEEPLLGLERPAIAELKVELEGVRSLVTDQEQRNREAIRKLDVARSVLLELRRLSQEQDAQLERLRVVAPLADALRGKNPKGVSLSRYLLVAHMQEVLQAASQRLLKMSSGRYALDLADSRVGHASAGLDLVVDDRFLGESKRPVRTLSGGEMFLASLSLAMGLSDVVQAHAGGIRMESLFIDEGFGSLDEETLDFAMQALTDLRAGGRLVGIVSHLEVLKERIYARISVEKSLEGSRVSVHA